MGLDNELNRARMLVAGIAYKKNVPDMRESPSMRIMELLHGMGAAVEFLDPTGEITGCVHPRVIEEHGRDFNIGAAVILKRVSVFSPEPGSHYLNVCPSNVARVFKPDTRLPAAIRAQFGLPQDE